MGKVRSYAFFSLAGFTFSRGSVYLKNDAEMSDSDSANFEIPGEFWKNLPNLISGIRSTASKTSNIVVLSPSHLLVPMVKIITGRPITLDAGWSLTEAEIARWRGPKSIPRIIRSLIIDWMAFQMASRIIVESYQQRSYISSRFCIKKSKISVLMTGFNEKNFIESSEKPIELCESKSSASYPTVLFRGSYTSEAGLELLSETTKKMENTGIEFIVLCSNLPKGLAFGKSTKVISRRLSAREMKYLYETATLCVGQISNRPRLKHTIPHKAFEAAFFGKPYVSSDALAIREFLPRDNQCYYLNHASVASLEKAILEITSNTELQRNLSLNIQKRYNSVASQAILSLKFYEIISS